MFPGWCYPKNMTQTNLSMKQKHGHREQAILGGCQGRRSWGRNGEWEVGVSRCKLLYIGWINNKVLLYSIEHYIQYHIISHNGKVYIYKSFCCTTVIQHCKSTILQ